MRVEICSLSLHETPIKHKGSFLLALARSWKSHWSIAFSTFCKCGILRRFSFCYVFCFRSVRRAETCSPRLERCKESQKDDVMIGAIFLRCAATPPKKCSVPPLQRFMFLGSKTGEETKIKELTYWKISPPQPQWSSGYDVSLTRWRSPVQSWLATCCWFCL